MKEKIGVDFVSYRTNILHESPKKFFMEGFVIKRKGKMAIKGITVLRMVFLFSTSFQKSNFCSTKSQLEYYGRQNGT